MFKLIYKINVEWIESKMPRLNMIKTEYSHMKIELEKKNIDFTEFSAIKS